MIAIDRKFADAQFSNENSILYFKINEDQCLEENLSIKHGQVEDGTRRFRQDHRETTNPHTSSLKPGLKQTGTRKVDT